VTHITIKGGCTHNCEIFADFFLNGEVNSREIYLWNVTNYMRQEAEQEPERSEGSCEASCFAYKMAKCTAAFRLTVKQHQLQFAAKNFVHENK